jgi:hypothetical protein
MLIWACCNVPATALDNRSYLGLPPMGNRVEQAFMPAFVLIQVGFSR